MPQKIQKYIKTEIQKYRTMQIYTGRRDVPQKIQSRNVEIEKCKYTRVGA